MLCGPDFDRPFINRSLLRQSRANCDAMKCVIPLSLGRQGPIKKNNFNLVTLTSTTHCGVNTEPFIRSCVALSESQFFALCEFSRFPQWTWDQKCLITIELYFCTLILFESATFGVLIKHKTAAELNGRHVGQRLINTCLWISHFGQQRRRSPSQLP